MTTRPLDLFYYLIFLVLAVLSCIIIYINRLLGFSLNRKIYDAYIIILL